MPLVAGSWLDSYEIIAPLGAGGMRSIAQRNFNQACRSARFGNRARRFLAAGHRRRGHSESPVDNSAAHRRAAASRRNSRGRSQLLSGRTRAFTENASLYMADRDGSNVHKLLTAPGSALCPSVSQDGSRIVLLTSSVSQERTFFLVEAKADGSDFHEIIRGTKYAPVRCAFWTPDGK
jgi:hypothetical protein